MNRGVALKRRSLAGARGHLLIYRRGLCTQHDPRRIEPCYDMIEFDMRLGTPRLHDLARSVEARERKTILPPDLFLRYQKDAFREDLTLLPPTVKQL